MSTLRAEWTKAITLRSVQGTLLAALVVPPALAFASGLAFDPAAVTASSFPIQSHGFETAGFGQPLVILLAALISGTEFLDGQLRTTLGAVPKRGRVLGAKLVLIALMAALIGLVATTAAVVLKHSVLGAYGLSPSEFTAAMGWNLLGVAANYALIALIAASITIIARTFIVALVVLVPLVLGVTISLLGPLPILRFLPDLAGIQLLTGYPGIGLLDPIPGGIVMLLWALILCGIAWLAFDRRDVGG